MSEWRTKNLAPTWQRAWARIAAQRAEVVDVLSGHPPMTVRQAWLAVSGDDLPTPKALQKLYSYWGRMQTEPRNGQGARIAEAVGWPKPKQGRPKRGQS